MTKSEQQLSVYEAADTSLTQPQSSACLEAEFRGEGHCPASNHSACHMKF